MFVFGIFLSPLNVHVIVIALPYWYADCMDPAFSPHFFCYIKAIIDLVFGHCPSILTDELCGKSFL